MNELHPQASPFPVGLIDAGGATPGAERQDMSVAGVLLLSALTVVMAILSVVMLGAIVLGAWWLVSHIPVPAAIRHLAALLHL